MSAEQGRMLVALTPTLPKARRYDAAAIASSMPDPISQLCALTCLTAPATPLSMTLGNDGTETPIAPPLGDKICCPVEDSAVREQLCTQLQLIAATQSIRHPWLSLAGLYRVIVALDRRSAVLANKGLLEAIGQSVEMYEGEQGAFAFPCEHGIVVVLPMHIVGYAIAPATEAERQYGFTTIWHELAHAHALALDYWPHGKLRKPRASASLQLASLMWHEFFADRHSHWPGFPCAFEHRLVERALQQARSNPTNTHVAQLLVDVARAYGRIGASQPNTSVWLAAFPQSQALRPVASAWQACAHDLEDACASLIANKASPSMAALERSSQALHRACQAALRNGTL